MSILNLNENIQAFKKREKNYDKLNVGALLKGGGGGEWTKYFASFKA